jgi:hypothetical protein
MPERARPAKPAIARVVFLFIDTSRERSNGNGVRGGPANLDSG